jgi:hypothetical protein
MALIQDSGKSYLAKVVPPIEISDPIQESDKKEFDFKSKSKVPAEFF